MRLRDEVSMGIYQEIEALGTLQGVKHQLLLRDML